MPRQVTEYRLVVQGTLTEPVVGRERHPRRRAWQAVKVSLRSAGLLDIEPREPDGGTCHVKKYDQPVPAFAVENGVIHDQRGGETKRDDVDKRIELRAKTRSAAGSARDSAIKSVGNSPQDDQQSGEIELSARS